MGRHVRWFLQCNSPSFNFYYFTSLYFQTETQRETFYLFPFLYTSDLFSPVTDIVKMTDNSINLSKIIQRNNTRSTPVVQQTTICFPTPFPLTEQVFPNSNYTLETSRSILKIPVCLNVMVHTSNSSSSEAMAGGPGVRCSSLGYIAEIKWQLQRPPQKKRNTKTGSAYAISWTNWISRDGARAVYDLTIFLVDLFFKGAENHILGIYCS